MRWVEKRFGLWKNTFVFLFAQDRWLWRCREQSIVGWELRYSREGKKTGTQIYDALRRDRPVMSDESRAYIHSEENDNASFQRIQN